MGGAGSTGRAHSTLSHVPLSLGGSSTGCSERAWFWKGHAGIGPKGQGSGPVHSPPRSGTETPSARFWSGMQAVLGLRAAGWGRSMRTQPGAPPEPCTGQCKSDFVGSHRGKTSWKKASSCTA